MVYTNYAARFNQFHNACRDFKGIGNHAWHHAQNPNDLALRICKLKKGGEAQRLMALAEFVLGQNMQDRTMRALADHLAPRLDKFGLKGKDAERRKKIQQLYNRKTGKPQPKKPVSKAHGKKHVKKQAHKKVAHRTPTRLSVRIAPKKTTPPAPIKADYFQNLSSYTIDKNHLQHTFKNAQPAILPEPPGISLTACMYEVFSHVLPTWPANLKITDDTSSRTKHEIVNTLIKNLERIENKSITHVKPENRTRLKAMYTNIFYAIEKKLAHLNAMAPKDREAFIRDVRSFIQNLGTTFYHCSARLLSDSTRYYLHFVENQRMDIDETTNCEDAVNQELVKQRRQAYKDAYFSVDTDRHDATTERYMNDAFNRPLGLHLPEYNDRNWENLALKGKKGAIESAFYKSYTPIRIAHQINDLIHQKKNSNNPWFSMIRNFLESKHHGLNWNDIFNFDEETYTLNGLKPQGMELLLRDLHIIKK